MADRPIPQALPPMFGAPEFPFSGALRSGPIADLLAGFAGAPGDLQQLFLNTLAPAGQAPPIATLPTQAQIMQGQQNWNAAPQPFGYSSIYSKAPELTAAFLGAPIAGQMRPWLSNILGMSPSLPVQRPAPDEQSGGPDGRHPQAYR